VQAKGGWTWKPFWEERDKIIQDYNKLVQKWNRFVPLINGKQKNIGRPLEASEAQIAQVLKLRKSGTSLRGIAEETNLGLSTVRTIIGKTNGTDRTTKRQITKIDAKQIMVTWKRQRRTGDSLPKRAHRVVKDGKALVKEAKGLGRS
jgi:hypothetical protein